MLFDRKLLVKINTHKKITSYFWQYVNLIVKSTFWKKDVLTGYFFAPRRWMDGFATSRKN